LRRRLTRHPVVRAADTGLARLTGLRAANATKPAADAGAALVRRTVGIGRARFLRRVVARVAETLLASRPAAVRAGGGERPHHRIGAVAEIDRQRRDQRARGERAVEARLAEVGPVEDRAVRVARETGARTAVAGAVRSAVVERAVADAARTRVV